MIAALLLGPEQIFPKESTLSTGARDTNGDNLSFDGNALIS
jgi:hypothetical protein